MRRSPRCGTNGCAEHRDWRKSLDRPCTWGYLDIPVPGNVAGSAMFLRYPDGSAEVLVKHRRAGVWLRAQPVDDVTAKTLIAVHNPPIFASDSRPPR